MRAAGGGGGGQDGLAVQEQGQAQLILNCSEKLPSVRRRAMQATS